MTTKLTSDQKAAIAVLLRAGNSVGEISKMADLDRAAVTQVARDLDVDPPTATQRRAKALYTSDRGLTYQEIAEQLREEKLKTEGGKAPHYLTVSTWVANYGWRWGGSSDGEYAPERSTTASRSKYVLRMSKKMSAELNSAKNISAAAKAAWDELDSEATNVVQLAVLRGAASVGVTDLAAVKKALFASHGSTLRTARP